MNFPAFFAQVPSLTLRDPLAALLGSAREGLIDYHFSDAVKLTGHACPTVASAWLMATEGLRVLYPDQIPVRGQIRVDMREAADTGVAGVIASVLTLLTGAAGEGGFKGLAGQHVRRQRLIFGVAGLGACRLTRLDTGRAVDCSTDLSVVPGDPRMGGLLGALLGGAAGPAEQATFADLWLARVERILLDTRLRPSLLSIQAV